MVQAPANFFTNHRTGAVCAGPEPGLTGSRSGLSDAIQQALQARMLTRRESGRGLRLHDACAPVCLGKERIRAFETQHLLEVFDGRIEMTDAIERYGCAEVVHGAEI